MQENLPYKFNDKKRKIVFSRQDLPSPWINYLSNGSMHAFVSQAGGGLCWWKTPQNFRITRYRFYNLPIDSPGFYVYIRMKDGTVWSPTFRPCGKKAKKIGSSHAPGYSEFWAERKGVRAKLTLFMSPDYDTLLWSLSLKNKNGEKVECDVFAYVELSQFSFLNEVNLGYYLKWQTVAEFDRELNAILYRFNSFVQVRTKDAPLVYFSSDVPVLSFCCDRDIFCGNYRDEGDPVEVERGELSDTELHGGEPCAALHSKIRLNCGEEKQVNYFLGVTPGALVDYEKARRKTKSILTELKSEGAVQEQFEKDQKWWREHLGVLQCEIPDENAMREINTWNPVQSVVTARFSRSISSSASGIRGIGFRDTCQDMLAQAYRKPEWAKKVLFYLASQQFEDGSTVHQSWPEDCKLPQVATRSDNHIWMSYLAYAVAAETGDLSFLDEEIPFLDKDLKSEASRATLWGHLLRGISFTAAHKGAHDLPLILFSDWNDHLGPFGRKGKGESIFVSQQHIYQLKLLSELAEARNDKKNVEYFHTLIVQQEAALSQYGWDGKWYRRGYDDEGEPIGTHTAKNARIWVNTQSWNVIAGAGTRKHDLTAMDSVKEQLDTGMGLMINFPSLPDVMVNGLPKGYSENGGVFCQANCWAIMAEALLGRGDIAWKYYKQLIPHEVIEKIGVEKYHNEAYAYSSTMLGPDNEKFGWACVSQVTGTAAWMDVVSTQYLLGVRPVLKGLLIAPCIPADWNQYTVERIYRGCKLTIQVENPKHVQSGVKKLYFDGKEIGICRQAMITPDMIADKKAAAVKVIMG